MSKSIETQNPFELYKRGLLLYAFFKGRASRKEYWSFHLLNFLFAFILLLIDPVLPIILFLATILPGAAVFVRRLHDVGQSGWWALIGWIPLIGNLILLIWLVSKGEIGSNQYGRDPFANSSDIETGNYETKSNPQVKNNPASEGNKKSMHHEYFCETCNKKVSEDSKFCKYCGSSFEAPACATCGKQLSHDSKFCENCGEQIITTNEQQVSTKTRLYIDPAVKISMPRPNDLKNVSETERLGWWLIWEIARESQRLGGDNVMSDEEAMLLRSSEVADNELKGKVLKLTDSAASRACKELNKNQLVRYPRGLTLPKTWNEKIKTFIEGNSDWELINIMKNFR